METIFIMKKTKNMFADKFDRNKCECHVLWLKLYLMLNWHSSIWLWYIFQMIWKLKWKIQFKWICNQIWNFVPFDIILSSIDFDLSKVYLLISFSFILSNIPEVKFVRHINCTRKYLICHHFFYYTFSFSSYLFNKRRCFHCSISTSFI